jgi:hypothetical protein
MSLEPTYSQKFLYNYFLGPVFEVASFHLVRQRDLPASSAEESSCSDETLGSTSATVTTFFSSLSFRNVCKDLQTASVV